MTVTNMSYADLASKQDQLIRKALEGSVFIAESSADVIAALTQDGEATGTPTLLALPDGYTDFGWTDDTGATFSSAVTTSDVTSWGSVAPTRRDITADDSTLHVVCQETRLMTIAAFTGVDSATVDAADATTGEVVVDKPIRPGTKYYRLLALGVDLGDDGEIYVAQFWPRAALTDKGDQVYASGDDAIAWDTTWTAFQDADEGYAVRYLFGGPGWKPLLTAMGFGA